MQENKENQKIMRLPFSFLKPRRLTKVYAIPAPIPPISPAIAGITAGLSNPGFIISTLPKNAAATPSSCTKFGFSFNRFLSSFSGDYDNISGDVQTEKTITIWANWGRDQIRVLNNLIQSSFTPKTNIGVNLKMSNASYIQAILSGNGPDCSLHMARSEPVNLALRGAMYDLKQFSDYETVMQRFMTKDSAVPFIFQNGVYALPDTINFYMMFYRTDIFEQYDLKVPTTWDEFIQVSSVLYRNKLQASLPYTQITTAAMVNAGVGSLSIYPSLLMQMGGKLYDDGLTYEQKIYLIYFRYI